MGSALPRISEDAFGCEITRCSPRPVGLPASRALYLHYQELYRWNPTLSLVGPGTAGEVVSRHYGEALQSLELLPETAFLEREAHPVGALNLVDIGTGAGFPGFVLAAVCPGLQVTLVEARERKWSFLRNACRKSGVSCLCVNSRVQVPLTDALPDTIHLLTLRALSLPETVFDALRAKFSESGRLLLWQTLPQTDEPAGFKRLRTILLPESERRCIGEYGIDVNR